MVINSVPAVVFSYNQRSGSWAWYMLLSKNELLRPAWLSNPNGRYVIVFRSLVEVEAWLNAPDCPKGVYRAVASFKRWLGHTNLDF